MHECWDADPKKRPTFKKIVEKVEDILGHETVRVSGYCRATPQPPAPLTGRGGWGWRPRKSEWSVKCVALPCARASSSQTVLPTRAICSQVINSDGGGYRLATHLARVGWSWIELARIWSSSNFRPTRAKLFCYCAFVFRLFLWYSCELAWLGNTVWPPADARFDCVTWRELAWVGSNV